MSVARVTEITATSPNSFDDAVREGIERVHKTLKNVQGAWIEDQKINCRDGAITEYVVRMKVTFVLND